mgnify:CR=1 FL=1
MFRSIQTKILLLLFCIIVPLAISSVLALRIVEEDQRRAQSFLAEQLTIQALIQGALIDAHAAKGHVAEALSISCLLYTSPSPRDRQ